MKNPVRTVESRYHDRATFDFNSLTITWAPNSPCEPMMERVPDKTTMWRKLREVRATFTGRDY
jgi:hypothetical protein